MKNMTREQKIILEIKNNPGIRFRELMKSMKITNGVMSYYIQKLEKTGVVNTERTSGVLRLFSESIEISDMNMIKFLRISTPKKIIAVLLEKDLLTFKQITEKIQMSPSTTSFYLTKLVNTGILSISNVFPRRYLLNNKQRLTNLITLYHPSVIDISSENLADIFSSD
jgi:predicted transcriptional regulator